MRLQDLDFSDAYAPETGIRETYDNFCVPAWMLAAIAAPGLLLAGCAVGAFSSEQDAAISSTEVQAQSVEVAPK